MTLAELVARWRADADLLEAYGDVQGSAAARLHAQQLEAALAAAEEEALTLGEAAAESGYSERRLRELVADGAIPNAGEKGRPRIRRRDLPRKARAPQARGFDPGAEALAVLSGGRS